MPDKAKGHAEHALVLDGFDFLLIALEGSQRFILFVDEGGEGGTIDIRVEYSHFGSLVFQGCCYIYGDCALADSSLAAGHSYDLFYSCDIAFSAKLAFLGFGGQ